METLNKQKWEDLNLTRDEIRNIGQALQKEEFRNLLLDYVKEINDPENRKLYEREITQLENERGVDVKFIHPSSGYVIKTSVDGKSKAFINICSNSNVGTPSSSSGTDGGHHGLHWSIPHCLAPPREDVDKKNNACIVYDVVYHPDTLRLSRNNVGFKHLVNDTALDAVEKNFHVSLDKINLKFPKMQFKGAKHPTVIRKKLDNYEPPSAFIDLPNYPYLPVQETMNPDEKSCKQIHNGNSRREIHKANKGETYTTPKYTIKYRNRFDMQNFTQDPLSKMYATVPNEVIIVIDLPLLKSSTDASIDITGNVLYLLSETPKYKLNLSIPYIVDSNNGNAKFDTGKKVLTVTLPVLKHKNCPQDFARDDSGVESDSCIVRSNSASSDEDINEKVSTINRTNSNKDFNNETNLLNADTHSFLKPNIQYVLPSYNCQCLKDTLIFTLQVAHVNPDSVEYCFLKNFSGFHLSFQSVGAGFFPVNYAICVLLPYQNQISVETFNVEVWDNNVITQVKFTTCGLNLSEYYIGIDEGNVEKIAVTELKRTIEEIQKKQEKYENKCEEHLDELSNDKIKTVSASNDGITLFRNQASTEYYSSDIESAPNTKKDNINYKLSEEEKDLSVSESADESTSSLSRQSPKSRTVSESQQGDVMRTKSRGILKIGRSLSESSVDDYASWSEKNEKTKKTVRFSEVISKQTFRMNSSILGQRKKNQRKTRNKKRAQERRFSESGGESECENEVASLKGKTSGDEREVEIWLIEGESSSCDVSEVSEVSDISESDDGQKEDVKSFMPCSNRRNHKRRGKKSARKNAATAKFQYMEN